MPPDSRVVTADRYPTLRMIEKGGLRWGLLKAGSDPTASPEVIFRESQFRWIGWDSSPDRRVVLFNTDKEPVQFVEWSVAPARDTTP